MPKRILLADDSAAASKSVEKALGTDEYQLIIAEDGRVAMEQVSTAQPHLVLAHAMLAEVDGYEVCRQIKENPDTSHIPVLLLTGTFEPFDINRAKESRYDGFVTKPLDGPELVNLVSRSIDNAVYPAVEPVVQQEPEETGETPEEPIGVTDFPGGGVISDTITKSDAMLDRIFPEEEPPSDFVTDDGSSSVDEGGENDIFAVIDPMSTPETETEALETDEAVDEPAPLVEAEAEENDGGTVDRSSPDFGIWNGGEQATATEEAAAGEEQEISAEDSDLSWFLRKYEEKMEATDDDAPEETADEEPGEPEAADMETITAEPLDLGENDEVTALEDTGFADEPVGEPEAETSLESLEPLDDAVAAAPPLELDDGQLEQVARRVVELLSETVVRDVAWEAVPEIAERLIRERIREIEEEADSSS